VGRHSIWHHIVFALRLGLRRNHFDDVAFQALGAFDEQANVQEHFAGLFRDDNTALYGTDRSFTMSRRLAPLPAPALVVVVVGAWMGPAMLHEGKVLFCKGAHQDRSVDDAPNEGFESSKRLRRPCRPKGRSLSNSD
jgi:hypothetical protein